MRLVNHNPKGGKKMTTAKAEAIAKAMTTPAAKEKAAKKPFQTKPGVKERNRYIESLIKKGTKTGIQITAAVLKKYPDHSKSGITTMISDSKNPKYNKFAKLTKTDPKTKILSC
jgi:hypothetical protein